MTDFLTRFIKDFKGKKILVMGLGLQGRGVQDAAFFCKIGAKVLVTDLKTEEELKSSLIKLKNLPIKYILGKHREKDILEADVILRNADVPYDSSFLKLARDNNIPIEMDESLFAKYAPVKIIGITGTRGKSTTTILIYKILKEAGLPVFLGGNFLGVATLPLLEKVRKNDFIVAELSSWQLQGFNEAGISPHIAVITSIYEDHLNRYSSIATYINDKKAIFKNQSNKDYLILNKDDVIVNSFAKETQAKIIWFSKKDFPANWQLKIKGEHNKMNAAAAIKISEILRIDKKITQLVIENFTGLPYRLETIAIINSVCYVNDSTSTTPAAGIVALKSFSKPIILIAGGNSKRLNMELFARAIAEKVKKVIFLTGTETDKLIRLIKRFKAGEKIGSKFNNLEEALLEAKRLTKAGDIILFSPGCTSFGMFANEFDRGDQFNKIVKSWQK